MDGAILKRLLDRVPDNIDKRQGSVMYLALAPVAVEIERILKELNKVMERTFADTAEGEDLTKRVAERGVNRKPATKAIRKGVFNKAVDVGSRFGIESVSYVVIEALPGNEAKLMCEQYGEIGNLLSGDLLPLSFIEGLTTAKLTDVLIPGEEVETDISLRQRYFEGLESNPFGGNKADYKEKTKGISGVGAVKVFPIGNGAGTVKLVVLDSQFNKPSTALVSQVQEIMDPISATGMGVGIAPIGHKVTVEGVSEVKITVRSTITLVSGYVWEDVSPYIQQEINNYLLELRQAWETEPVVVRISQLESAVLRVTGVLDIIGTTINNQATNLILSETQIPVLQEVIRI